MAVSREDISHGFLDAALAARRARGIVDPYLTSFSNQAEPFFQAETQNAAQLINAVNALGARGALASYGFTEENLYAVPAGTSVGVEAGAMPFLEGLRREATLRANEANEKTAAAVEVQSEAASDVSRRRRARGLRATGGSVFDDLGGEGLLA